MSWSNSLFTIAFIAQIFLMSYYFPRKLLARMRHVLATYPPEMYPKLYPQPVEHYKLAQAIFKYVCGAIFVLGFLILAAILFWVDHSTFADHGFISEAWPAGYGMLQFLPLMGLEFSEFSHFRKMRGANSASRRSADLRRRSLTDLVSPGLLSMTVLLFAGAILFDLYVHDFAVTWGHDTIQRAIVLTVTNGFLAFVGAWNLYGRKLDPHESAEDRIQRISAALKSMLYVSMALSIFIAITAADDMYNLDFVAALIMSLYFQAIALLSLGYTLRSIDPDKIDFDVYKNDAAAA